MFQQQTKRPASLIVLLYAILLADATTTRAYTMVGNIGSYASDDHSITFECENARVKLSFLTDDLIRVHMAPAGTAFPADTLHEKQNGPYAVVKYDWPGVEYKISESFDFDLEGFVYKIKAGNLIVKVRKEPFKLAFYDADGRLLLKENAGIANAGLGFEADKVYETMELPGDEHFFGFGAHNHDFDLRGKKLTCAATELQTKAWTGGFGVPFFLSTRGYGIFFNNLDDDVTFDMGTKKGQYHFEATSGKREGWDMDYYLIHGPKFADILKRYIEIVGKPMLPEKYFLGHIFMECCEWNARDVVDVATRFRKDDYPCDVLIIDCQALNGAQPAPKQDWDKDQSSPRTDGVHRNIRDMNKTGFDWADSFGDTAEMFSEIKKLGYKTILSSAIQGRDIYNWPSYDPTVPKNCDDYWATIAGRNIDGLDSWRQDNSEKYHIHTGIKKFANGYESHNLFGSLWAKNVVQGMEKLGLYGRPVISRGGPVGGHRYIIPWPGDLHHGLDLLKVDLNWLRNGGLSAYPFVTVNLGGWGSGHGLEEQNLVRRIIDIIPIIPISQLVGWGKTGENAMLPWLMTQKQQNLLRYYLKLRYRLHPYIYSSAIESHLTARPILAALVFDYQNDRNTYDKDYHFMLGRQLLVAPVLEKAENWNVYLPKGKWIHYWTGKEYTGGRTINIAAPLYSNASLPMFVKAGAIIPMMPTMSYIYEKKPDPITLDIYPDKDNASQYIMYDRRTVRSPDIKTTFTCVEDNTRIEVTISPSAVSYELCVHYDKAPAEVTVDAEESPNLKSKSAYDSAASGYYFGPGCFYGCETSKTINIKIPKTPKPHKIKIIK